MRLLMIAPTSFFADYGCHVRILEQARGLVARGHRITLCTYHTGRDVRVPGLDIRRTPRIPWRRGVEVGSSWHKLVLDALLFFLVLATARRQRPDVLHAYLHEGALIGYWVGRLLGIPLAFDYQGSLTGEMVDHRFLNPKGLAFRPMWLLERWIDRQPAVVLANSHHSRQLLANRFGVRADKIRVVHDYVDAERFAPAPSPGIGAGEDLRARLGVPPGAVVIVYLGLLANYQGVELLLQAMRGLGASREWHLLIMGFPNVEHYRGVAHALGLSKQVTFTGAIPYEDAHRMLALGDIAVGPKISATEGSGKLLNYMAMALPTVAFDIPVSREYMGDEGILVPVGDVRAMKEAIFRLIEDPDMRTRCGSGLRVRAMDCFAPSGVIHEIEAAYRSVCDAPRGML